MSLPTQATRIYSWRTLFLSGDSPQKLALAGFLGILIGTSPFLGFHFLLSAVVAAALRLNLAAIYLCANISIPPIAPFIIFASIQIGHLFVHGSFLPVPESLTSIDPWQWLIYWWLGSVVFGSIVGIVVAALIYVISHKLLNRRLRSGAMQSLSDCYDSIMATCAALKTYRFGEAVHGFFKCTFDPVFEQLWLTVKPGATVCDLGGGRGYFLAMHHRRSPCALNLIEWDSSKLAVARHILPPSATLVQQDLRDWQPTSTYDVVLLIDVLHYLSFAQQDVLLAKAASALNANGMLIIRDMDPERRFIVKITAFYEFVCLRVGLTRGERINPRPLSTYVTQLTNQNFRVTVEDSSAGLGFANSFLTATNVPSE